LPYLEVVVNDSQAP